MMPDMTPPPDGNRTMGPTLLGIIWTQVALDVVIVALRFMVRIKKRALGADDWNMLVALLFFIPTVAVENVIVNYGLGRHMFYVPMTNTVPFLKWVFILQSFTFYTLAFAKLSIALMIMRLIGPDRVWRKRFLWANIVLFFIFSILTSIFGFVACRPIEANWQPGPNAKCWPLSINANWAIFISAYSAFLDFVLAALPITLMWKLQLDTKKKALICILLGLGIFSGIAAAIKTSLSRTLGSRSDFTWNAWSLYAWSTTEFFLNIFCGSVPAIKPLYDYIVKGKPMVRDPPVGGKSAPIFWSMSGASGRFKSLSFSRLWHSSSSDSRMVSEPKTAESVQSGSMDFGRNSSNDGSTRVGSNDGSTFITVHDSAKDRV